MYIKMGKIYMFVWHVIKICIMIRMGGIGLGTRIILLIIYMIDMYMYI